MLFIIYTAGGFTVNLWGAVSLVLYPEVQSIKIPECLREG